LFFRVIHIGCDLRETNQEAKTAEEAASADIPKKEALTLHQA
jgi:hypothetical protein